MTRSTPFVPLFVLSLLPLIACGDKDGGDTGDTAGDSGSTDTDGGDTDGGDTDGEGFGDPPEAGSLVAVMDINGITGTLVCQGEVVYMYEDQWDFNNLLHDSCATTAGSDLLLSIRSFPATDLSAWPGGNTEIEAQTDNPGNRLYASAATTFLVETSAYDPATGEARIQGRFEWPTGSLRLWIDNTGP